MIERSCDANPPAYEVLQQRLPDFCSRAAHELLTSRSRLAANNFQLNREDDTRTGNHCNTTSLVQ